MKKILLILLTVVLAFSSVIGCSSDNNEGNTDADGNVVTDPSKILDISVWNSGYGVKWIEELAKNYKQTHSGVAINIVAKSGDSGTGDFYNTITSGAQANSTDLYLAYGPKYLQYVTGSNANNKYLEPLDDVLSYTNEGESKTIKEKIGNTLLDALTYNGQTYCLTYDNSVIGIIYNKKLFEEYGLEVPKTTQELYNLSVEAKEYFSDNNITDKNVFIHYPGYWQYAVRSWWLQYEGKDNFNKFWSFSNVDIHNMSTQKDNYYQDGFKKGLKELEKIIAPEGNTYTGSNTMDFIKIQSRFLESEVALMYPCGSWLETEMLKGEGFDANIMNNFAMMKFPVLSSIASKLSQGHDNEASLIELIDYVDGNGTRPAWAKDEDVEVVAFARNCVCPESASSSVLVPSYSPAKSLAKDFLKYMYSDNGMLTFANAQHCTFNFTPDNPDLYDSCDISSWSTFSKSVFDIGKSVVDYVVPINMNSPLLFRTSFELFDHVPESVFTNSSKTDRKNAEEFIDMEWGKLMEQWSVYLGASGL